MKKIIAAALGITCIFTANSAVFAEKNSQENPENLFSSNLHPFIGFSTIAEVSSFNMTFNDQTPSTKASYSSNTGLGISPYLGLKYYIPQTNLRVTLEGAYQTVGNEKAVNGLQVTPEMNFQKYQAYTLATLLGYAFDKYELYGKIGYERSKLSYAYSAVATLNYTNWTNGGQIGFGGLYNITPHIGIRSEYTYTQFNNVTFNGRNGLNRDNETLKLTSNLVSLGLEWTF